MRCGPQRISKYRTLTLWQCPSGDLKLGNEGDLVQEHNLVISGASVAHEYEKKLRSGGFRLKYQDD